MMAPRERGAIRPRDLRVTKRESTSRSGTSPPRSVHQWTARAWVPVCLAGPSDSRPSTYLLSTPIRPQIKALTLRQPWVSFSRSLQKTSRSGEATEEDRVCDATAFVSPGHDGLSDPWQGRQRDEGISNGGHASQPRVRHVPQSVDLPTLVIVIVSPIALMTLAWILTRADRRRREFGSPVDRKTYDTLHTASLAAKHLHEGLTEQGATKAAKHLRAMLGTQAIALCDRDSALAWDGAGTHHRDHVCRHASEVLTSGRTVVLDAKEVACGDPTCPIRTAILAPIISDERVVAALAAYGPNASAGLVRATEEVAGWVSTQVELADLGRQRSRATEAELRALRAQISPHFIYNALAAIASFVRTDPDRARELLLEFADFTRYAFRRGGAFTTLAEELGNIEHFRAMERG